MHQLIASLRSHSQKLILAAILILTALSYSNVFNNAFLWDDGYFVDYQNFQSFSDIPTILQGDQPMSYGQVYRPVRNLIYLMVNQLLPSQPFGYHLIGITAHLIITYLVFHIIKHLTNQPTIGYIGALLFGLHPIHTEAVTWITASFDTIGLAFFFISFFSYLKYRITNQSNWFWRFALSGWLAFFTYELTFVLLPIIILYEYIYHPKKDIWHSLRQPKTLWFALAAYSIARVTIVPDSTSTTTYLFGNPISQLLFIPVLLFHYLRLIIVPYPLSINHQIYPNITNFFHLDTIGNNLPKLQLLSPDYLIPTICILILAVLTKIALQTSHRHATFALAWFFIGLGPVLQIIPQNSVFAERYAYISSFGIIFLTALLLQYLIHRKPIVGKISLSLIVVSFLILTFNRNQDWHDMFSFWGKEARKDPPSAFAMRQLAAGYYMKKEYHAAIQKYQKALKYYPEDPETHFKIGYLYYLQKQCDQADTYFSTVQEYQPTNLAALNYTADCYQTTGATDQAIKHYQESLSINPHQIDIQQRLQQLTQQSNK